jgi:spore maturation protein CgeB
MWVATQAAFGDITPRYYEVGASNTLLVCQRVPVQYKDIFRDGENCVQFEKDLSDFDEKIDYYLKNDDERCKIAKTAYDEFRRKHTWAVKASALTKIIQEII